MNRINGWRKFKSDREFRGRCIVSILLLFAIVVIALPIIVASSMSFYCGDDFAQLPIKEFNGNIIELLWMALRYAKKMYLNWQGAYFSMFINIMLHPILGAGLTQLRVVMVINALMLVIAISVFVWELCKDEINLYYNKLLLIVCCVGGILGFECWQEIFYWYTGIAGYTIPFSLLLFALAIVIASRKRIYYFIAGVLIFCASGGSQAIAGIGCYWMLMIIIAKALKKKLAIKDIVVFGVGVFGALGNVLAPGNYVRHAAIDDSGLHFFRAIIYSFGEVIRTWEWLIIDTPFIIIAIISVAIGVIAGKRKYVDKTYCYIMIALSMIAPVVAYFPVCLGYSSSGSPNRCRFVLIFAIIISAIIFFVLSGEIFAAFFNVGHVKEALVIITLLAIIMPIERENWKISTCIPYRTMMALAEGKIQSYYHSVNRIYDLIREDENEDVFIYELPEPVDIFFTVKIQENPNYLINRECASFFGKNSVQYVSEPVYRDGDTYVRIAKSYFENDLSYVSIFNNKETSEIEAIQVLQPLKENMVLEIPEGETGTIVIFVFADAQGESVLEQMEIKY